MYFNYFYNSHLIHLQKQWNVSNVLTRGFLVMAPSAFLIDSHENICVSLHNNSAPVNVSVRLLGSFTNLELSNNFAVLDTSKPKRQLIKWSILFIQVKLHLKIKGNTSCAQPHHDLEPRFSFPPKPKLKFRTYKAPWIGMISRGKILEGSEYTQEQRVSALDILRIQKHK